MDKLDLISSENRTNSKWKKNVFSKIERSWKNKIIIVFFPVQNFYVYSFLLFLDIILANCNFSIPSR